ncbi:unnamed protein product [Callosobruchus maculatus]|uniref:Uncharacterized protein n=1 Tax=Callosobruchus maculatus TaxID=64391 RepID=A0A653D651_CALMS|nr:unnamed protein product [Callosobruchus maculatus]
MTATFSTKLCMTGHITFAARNYILFLSLKFWTFVYIVFISLISFLITTGYCLSYPQRQDYSQRQVDSKYPKDYATSKIVKHENNLGLTNYNFSYETSDGSQREETAELKNAGSENESLAVQGSYTYVGTDGLTYKVTYVADENGYRASGQHLPKTG